MPMNELSTRRRPSLILGVSCFVHVGGSVVPQHLGVRGTTVFQGALLAAAALLH